MKKFISTITVNLSFTTSASFAKVRHLAIGLTTFVLLLFCIHIAKGEVVITATETGGDVVFFGSGTLNLTSLVPNDSGGVKGFIKPSLGSFLLGADPDLYLSTDSYGFGQFSTIPFGNGGLMIGSTGSGDRFGLGNPVGFSGLFVPQGYVSGDPLAGTLTFSGTDFGNLGITPGSYLWEWGSGADADSITLNVVPEPSQSCNVQQIGILLADDGAAYDNFGYSVGISGTTTIVGAYTDDDNGFDSGAAYLFDTITGQQIAKLLPDDGAAEDYFGYSVAINDTTAIVGSPLDENGRGAVYLFDLFSNQQIAKLIADDGEVQDWFGWSVAISEDTLIVGARFDGDSVHNSGSAYLFDTNTGQQIGKLLADDGAVGDEFGFSVGISGTTAIIGARFNDDYGENSGAAYLFDTTTGQQIARLLPDNGAAGDEFGFSVGIDGTTALVGAPQDDDNGDRSGVVYLFETTTHQQIGKLLADDGAGYDEFGWSLAISGTTAIVGARFDDDNGPDSGGAYLFDTLTHQQIAKLVPDDGEPSDEFGYSVAISGTTTIVGAKLDDDNGYDAGSAYLFELICDGEVLPVSFEVVSGHHAGGGVPELSESDNADLFIRRDSSDIPSRTEFEVNAISPVTAPSSLEIVLEGAVFARSEVEQSVELFDYALGAWEQVDTRTATRFSDSTVTVACTGDLSRFVETGTMCMTARIRYQSTNPSQLFASHTDQFIWMIRQ